MNNSDEVFGAVSVYGDSGAGVSGLINTNQSAERIKELEAQNLVLRNALVHLKHAVETDAGLVFPLISAENALESTPALNLANIIGDEYRELGVAQKAFWHAIEFCSDAKNIRESWNAYKEMMKAKQEPKS